MNACPTFWILLEAFLFANFVAVVVLTWMPKFLYDKFHLSLAAAGLTATVFIQLASMIGSPVGGWLADRLRAGPPGGRMMVQPLGLLGAPFGVWWRNDAVDRMAHGGAHRVAVFQGFLRCEYFRVGVRCGARGGSRRCGG